MRGEQGDTELWGRCRRRLWDDEAVPGRLQRFGGGSGSETDALTHPHPVCCRRLLGAGGSLGAGPGEETQLALLCTSLLPKRPPPPPPQPTTPVGLSHPGHLLHLSTVRKVTPLGRSGADFARACNFTHSPGALGCQLSAQRQPPDFSRLQGSVPTHQVSFLCFSGACVYGQRAVCSHEHRI